MNNDTNNSQSKIDAQGQNKYPSFDMGGDNFRKNTPVDTPPPPNTTTTDPVTTPVQPAFTPPQAVAGSVPTTVSGSPQFSYASLGSRAMANFVDSLIIGFIYLIIFAPAFIFVQPKNLQVTPLSTDIDLGNLTTNFNTPQMLPTPKTSDTNTIIFTIVMLIASAIGTIYPIYFIGKKGATPGKVALKIKVVNRETKQPPGYLNAFLREYIGKFASSIFMYLGFFWAVWDKEKQAWHDKIAGTVVVNNN